MKSRVPGLNICLTLLVWICGTANGFSRDIEINLGPKPAWEKAWDEKLISPEEAKEIIDKRAEEILLTLKNKDYSELSKMVHQDGLFFYSSSRSNESEIFSAKQIEKFSNDQKTYSWSGDRGGEINNNGLTFNEYFGRCVGNLDYSSAKIVKYNEPLAGVVAANTLNHSTPDYHGRITVDYYVPSSNSEFYGSHWTVLSLGFKPSSETQWSLTSIFHKQVQINMPPAEAKATIEKRAEEALQVISQRDFSHLARLTHPDMGLKLSQYSFVHKEDMVVKRVDLPKLSSNKEKIITVQLGQSGNGEILTLGDYFGRYVYDQDYLSAPDIIFNSFVERGEGNNLFEFFPGAIVVEYHYPGFDPKREGSDWKSLYLVFEKADDSKWYLVDIAHAENTE